MSVIAIVVLAVVVVVPLVAFWPRKGRMNSGDFKNERTPNDWLGGGM